MNPMQHCKVSVRRWGGTVADYLPIHDFIDSTKMLCADGRHRVLHTHWAIQYVIVPIFGHTTTNSDGKQVDVKDLCERDHLLADYGNRFIPTLADFSSAIEVTDIAGLKRDIEHLHRDFSESAAIAELLLSPLAVTGQLKSLLITHNSWFLTTVVPWLFDVCPALDDYAIAPARLFNAMRFDAWMDNGIVSPPSARALDRLRVKPNLRAVP